MTEKEIFELSAYVIGGLAIGILVYKLIMPLIAKLAAKTSIKSDDLIISTIRKWVIPWFVATGLFMGLRRIEMEIRYHDWILNGLLIFFIFSLTLIIAKVVSGMIRIKSSYSDAVIPSSSIIGNIVRAIIYVIGLLIILQSQGISITPMLTALGVGGLAVALALQPTLSNLFAGLQIIASGKINHGDFVKLASGEDGFIEDITWRSTTIRGESDHLVVVPNSKLADMIVTNYYLPGREQSFNVELSVGYDNDLNHVENVTKEVIKEVLDAIQGGVKDFEPVIRFYAFGESRVNFRAILRVTEYSFQFAVRHEFIKRIHERYKKEGISIPFPVQTVHIRKDDA
jgi:small-conductance mechanosensitive channel